MLATSLYPTDSIKRVLLYIYNIMLQVADSLRKLHHPKTHRVIRTSGWQANFLNVNLIHYLKLARSGDRELNEQIQKHIGQAKFKRLYSSWEKYIHSGL